MSTVIPYFNRASAWYFLAILHRLAFKPDGAFTLAPRTKSPHTIRLRLMNGRRYVTDTKRPEFNRYEALSYCTKIKMQVEEKRIIVLKLDLFDEHYANLIRNPPMFDRICRDTMFFISDGVKTVYQQEGIDLMPEQVDGLRDYFKLFGAIRQAIVEPNLVLLRK